MLNVWESSSQRKRGKAVAEINSVHPRAAGKTGRTTSACDFYRTIDVSAENKTKIRNLRNGEMNPTQLPLVTTC